MIRFHVCERISFLFNKRASGEENLQIKLVVINLDDGEILVVDNKLSLIKLERESFLSLS